MLQILKNPLPLNHVLQKIDCINITGADAW